MVKSSVLLLGTLGLVAAAPLKREVPQEHSHEKILRSVNTFLKLNNPDGIVDAVFGLLGNAAASQGLGTFKDPDCLQTGTADRAFTNAKAKSDVQGMTDSLTYRALERNTGKVGLKSVLCTSFKPVNPEIAALTQHQDPASDGAAATNKAITLELAKQIKSIGGNPQDARLSGTFKPGNLNDNTGKGNTCDDANDAAGCIISQNLIVFDASSGEIDTAVGGSGSDSSSSSGSGSSASSGSAASSSSSSSSGSGSAAVASGGALAVGNCTDPSVKFGAGLDGRKATEFSFIPNNQAIFTHGSALNPDIIFQFTCDTFVNKCGFKQTDATVVGCRNAQAAADKLGKVGAAADLFNNAFGIKTNFAALSTAAPAASSGDNNNNGAAANNSNNGAAANNNNGNGNGNAASGALAVGNCTDPSVKFGAGLDGRKATEFSFIPNNQAIFTHGSALNPDIIFQFTCDTFVNKCGFKQTDATVVGCRNAQAAADKLGKVGAAADLFNNAFGIKTNFAALNTAAPAASSGNNNNNNNNNGAAANNNNNGGAAASSGALDFGKCSNPTIQFGPNLDGRKDNSFQAVNLQDFNHGSALNSGVITDFICLQFINKCGLTNASPAVVACKKGEAAATALGKVGAAADAFNKALGFTTDFAKVQ